MRYTSKDVCRIFCFLGLRNIKCRRGDGYSARRIAVETLFAIKVILCKFNIDYFTVCQIFTSDFNAKKAKCLKFIHIRATMFNKTVAFA